MLTFEQASSDLLWESTSVSNAYLMEFMPQAPENHVKVYLYCLMFAHAGLENSGNMLPDVARALDLPQEEVEKALRYWERCRLIERTQTQPPKYRFFSPQRVMLQRQTVPESKQDLDYESFAHAVCDAFGDKRTLHGGETVLAYEWVEQLKLPPEVVLMLIHHMIDTHGITFSFKKAQPLALQMSEEHVSTIEEAENVFGRSDAVQQGVRKVLNRLGMRRQPTVDETDLYIKWTEKWHFSQDSVLEACRETVKGRNPSFAYLDAILSKLQQSGACSETLSETLREAGKETEQIRTLLSTLGISAELIDDGMRLQYRHLLAFGGADLLQLAAETVRKTGRRWTLESVSTLLEKWQSQGITTVEAAKQHIASVDKQNARISELMGLAHSEQGRTLKNRMLLQKWQEAQLPDELVNAAAEISEGKKDFMAYMDALLTGWKEKGILTAQEAKQEHALYSVKTHSAQPVRKTIESNYDQRSYDPAHYDDLPPEQVEELFQQ